MKKKILTALRKLSNLIISFWVVQGGKDEDDFPVSPFGRQQLISPRTIKKLMNGGVAE